MRATAALIEAGEALVITPQIAAEFWYVATRSRERNGLGLSCDRARQELAELEGFVTIIGESPEVYQEWKNLLMAYHVSGTDAHDARLVAAMRVYGIRRLLTFDAGDFARYRDIEVVYPPSA